MPIPALTSHGVLPPGVHQCDFSEAEQAFVLAIGTPSREALWSNLMQYVSWVRTLDAFVAIFLDGSFVGDKSAPNDIDCALEPRWPISAGAFAALDNRAIKARFQLDVYPIIPNGNDLSAFFQYVRVAEALKRGMAESDRKGILRIVL